MNHCTTSRPGTKTIFLSRLFQINSLTHRNTIFFTFPQYLAPYYCAPILTLFLLLYLIFLNTFLLNTFTFTLSFSLSLSILSPILLCANIDSLGASGCLVIPPFHTILLSITLSYLICVYDCINISVSLC